MSIHRIHSTVPMMKLNYWRMQHQSVRHPTTNSGKQLNSGVCEMMDNNWLLMSINQGGEGNSIRILYNFPLFYQSIFMSNAALYILHHKQSVNQSVWQRWWKRWWGQWGIVQTYTHSNTTKSSVSTLQYVFWMPIFIPRDLFAFSIHQFGSMNIYLYWFIRSHTRSYWLRPLSSHFPCLSCKHTQIDSAITINLNNLFNSIQIVLAWMFAIEKAYHVKN